ncbi:hypothetical protein BH10PSE13_BH10PSE13_02320 [soil metagenome]
MSYWDLLGNRTCMAISWIGLAYIAYWHLAR